MKRVLYGAAIAAIMTAAPALAFAQSYPAVDAGQASASSHQPSYMQPVAPQAAPVYWNTGSFPTVNQGQASASAHGPSFGGELSTERSH